MCVPINQIIYDYIDCLVILNLGIVSRTTKIIRSKINVIGIKALYRFVLGKIVITVLVPPTVKNVFLSSEIRNFYLDLVDFIFKI